jgi:hypothetical protein
MRVTQQIQNTECATSQLRQHPRELRLLRERAQLAAHLQDGARLRGVARVALSA